MTDEKNPSQDERKPGVFDSIRGAHSRSTEPAEEKAEATKTTEPEKPAEPAGETAKPGDERLGRAAQRIAQLERQLNQLGPWAQFGMAVGNDPKGKTIVERYQKGQGMFEGDTEEAVDSINEERSVRGEPPLTRSELQNFMDQREAARYITDQITGTIEEEVPQFKKIKHNPKFMEFLDFARQSVWSGRTPLHESVVDWDNDYAAKEMTAARRALSLYIADNPKAIEAAKRAGKKEAEERAAQAASLPSPSGSSISSDEEGRPKSEADELIERMINPRGRGKSFSTVGRRR